MPNSYFINKIRYIIEDGQIVSKILAGDLVWSRPQVMVSRGFSNPVDPLQPLKPPKMWLLWVGTVFELFSGDCGEKMGMQITTLLTMLVFMQLIQDYVPIWDGSDVPLLTSFATAGFIILTASLLLTRLIILVKWIQSGKGNFFRKKSKDTVRCNFRFWDDWWYFRPSSAIWWWVMTIWKFEICATSTAYVDFFWDFFCLNSLLTIGRVKILRAWKSIKICAVHV